MVKILSNSGHTAYGVKEFVIDERTDLDYLPVDVPAGSVAICVADASVYMINSKGEWIEL